MLLILFLSLTLSGCTTESHRVMVTIKNTTDFTETIEFRIDDNLEISTSIDPKASVEREYELSQGDHVFELYREINGNLLLYKTENKLIESDDGVFFELE